jgi:hypothetical protein
MRIVQEIPRCTRPLADHRLRRHRFPFRRNFIWPVTIKSEKKKSKRKRGGSKKKKRRKKRGELHEHIPIREWKLSLVLLCHHCSTMPPRHRICFFNEKRSLFPRLLSSSFRCTNYFIREGLDAWSLFVWHVFPCFFNNDYRYLYTFSNVNTNIYDNIS